MFFLVTLELAVPGGRKCKQIVKMREAVLCFHILLAVGAISAQTGMYIDNMGLLLRAIKQPLYWTFFC